jgi:microcystin-dependent protein
VENQNCPSERPYCAPGNKCEACEPGKERPCVSTGACLEGKQVCKANFSWSECKDSDKCGDCEFCKEKQCVVAKKCVTITSIEGNGDKQRPDYKELSKTMDARVQKSLQNGAQEAGHRFKDEWTVKGTGLDKIKRIELRKKDNENVKFEITPYDGDKTMLKLRLPRNLVTGLFVVYAFIGLAQPVALADVFILQGTTPKCTKDSDCSPGTCNTTSGLCIGKAGKDGQDGVDGAKGSDGKPGADGKPGKACTILTTSLNSAGNSEVVFDCDGTRKTLIVNKGPKGADGKNGTDGKNGPTGPKGADGKTGSSCKILTQSKTTTGTNVIFQCGSITTTVNIDKGVQGPQGTKGDKGDTGARGLIGPQGPQGTKGTQGNTGIQGPKGDKGDSGIACKVQSSTKTANGTNVIFACGSQTTSVNIDKDVPAGTVTAFAGARGNVPAGWVLCDGRKLSKTANNGQYAALFKAIGYAYGTPSNPDEFYLPDYRGLFLRGVAHGSTNDPDRLGRTPVRVGANSGDKVGSVQTYSTARPLASFTATGKTTSPGTHYHTGVLRKMQPYAGRMYSRATSSAWNNSSSNRDALGDNTSQRTDESSHSHTVSTTVNGGGDKETRPRNASVNYIIKF